MAGTTTVDRLLLMFESNVNTVTKQMTAFERTIQAATKAHQMQERFARAGLSKTANLTKQNAKAVAMAEMRSERLMNIGRKMQNMFLSFGMAFLFTGMQLSRMFKEALQGLMQTFLSVEGQTGPVNEAVNQLRAAWEFFKYSVIEAFKEEGGLERLLNTVEGLIEKFNSLDNGAKSFIASFLVVGFVSTTVMMAMGQMFLFMIPLATTLSVSLWSLVLPLVIVMATVAALFAIWLSDMSTTKKVLLTIAVVLIGIGLILALLVSPWFLIAAAVGVVIAAIVLFKDEIWLAMLKAGKAVKDFLIDSLNSVIGLINKIISGFNNLPGVSISLIPEIQDLGADYTSRIAATEARIAEKRAARNGGEDLGMTDKVTNIIQIESITGVSSTEEMFEELERRTGYGNGAPQE